MTQKAVSMEVKLAAALARLAAGEKVNITAVAAELGISRTSFYKYRDRFALEGVEGLFARSRRPRHSPGQTPAVIEAEICRLRKQLDADGWDNGAISIRYALLDAACQPLPSARTIHRVLRRHGLVVDAPAKRPRSALRRFEYPVSNDCWQIDAFEYRLADTTKAAVFQVIDDHSRLEVDSYACPGETGEGAWACWIRAVAARGVPAMVLSDNGAALSGARRGWEVDFERNARALGTRTVTSSPYHPQTCGKDERVHRTIRKWLAARPAATDLTQLQTQLDTWRPLYNTRRHQGIHGQRPADRYAATDKATADTTASNQPEPMARITHPLADNTGKTGIDGHIVGLGAQYAHARLTTIRKDDHIAIFNGLTLIRELTLDRTRRYQPSGTTPGGKHRPRINPTPRRRSTTANPADAEEDVQVQRPQRSEDERP